MCYCGQTSTLSDTNVCHCLTKVLPETEPLPSPSRPSQPHGWRATSDLTASSTNCRTVTSRTSYRCNLRPRESRGQLDPKVPCLCALGSLLLIPRIRGSGFEVLGPRMSTSHLDSRQPHRPQAISRRQRRLFLIILSLSSIFSTSRHENFISRFFKGIKWLLPLAAMPLSLRCSCGCDAAISPAAAEQSHALRA